MRKIATKFISDFEMAIISSNSSHLLYSNLPPHTQIQMRFTYLIIGTYWRYGSAAKFFPKLILNIFWKFFIIY